MTTTISKRQSNPWYERLFLPAYDVGEAARYAGTHSQTVASWHYRRGSVLPGHLPRQPLSYLDLVEVAFVAFFRRAGVTLGRIRDARKYVGETLGADYPFAEYKFKTEGCHILLDYLPIKDNPMAPGVIVADAAGQLAWDELMGDRFAEFDYELDLAVTWHPAGRDSVVRIDPRIAFGKPIAEGIPTGAIKGRWIAGESLKSIKEDFGVSEQAITDALTFEGVDIDSIRLRA